MSCRYDVISIGTLSRNRIWEDPPNKRFPHATTTLIRDDQATILVDPSLPVELLAQRLEERTGLTPDRVDTVFLTTFRPIHRRGLALFAGATWVMYGPEIDAFRTHLQDLEQRAEEARDEDVLQIVREERACLRDIRPADEKLTRQVHLFPSPGVTPGAAALLLATPTRTTIVAGDAVLTRDHFQAGRISEQVASIEQARESLAEIAEIADEIVPGHDNLFVPSR